MKPRDRNVKPGDIKCDIPLNPHRPHVQHLIVSYRLKDRDSHHGDQGEDDAPVGGSKSADLATRPLDSRGQVPVAAQISRKTEEHEDSSHAETVVPAV